jgi:alkylation response protein AidB-like acyl-CoA dehydrogenase
MEELGRADSAVRGIVSVSSGLFGKIVLAHGTEEQKQQWLPGIATGTWADVAVVFARTGSVGPRGDQGPFGRTSQRMASGGSGRT